MREGVFNFVRTAAATEEKYSRGERKSLKRKKTKI